MSIQGQIQQWVRAQHGTALGDAQTWWRDATHHGCFCGAGSDCNTPVDGLDECCKAHDEAYGNVGLNANNMWDFPDGFTKARQADADLVACAGSAQTNETVYKEALVKTFEARVMIADAILRWQAFERWLLAEAPQQTPDQRRQSWATLAGDLTSIGVTNDELYAAMADHPVDFQGSDQGSTLA